MIHIASLLLVFCLRAESARGAQGWKLDVFGGISSPAPGVAGGMQGCRAVLNGGCAGVSVVSSHNVSASRNMNITANHVLGVYEQTFPVKDEYHLIVTHAAIGGAYVVQQPYQDDSDPGSAFKKWCPSFGAGLGVELPLADLLGLRFLVLARYPAVKGGVAQVASMVGLRFGVEWLGVGN